MQQDRFHSLSCAALVWIFLVSLWFVAGSNNANAGALTHHDDGRGILVSEGDRPVLRYNYQPHPDVAGRESGSSPAAVMRSGYIHPVWTPAGRIVTEAFPESHFHHLGVWGAWVKTRFKGEAYDFWNLKTADEAEQVSFTVWESAPQSNGESTRFKAQHVYTLETGGESKVVLEEALEVNVFKLDEGNAFDYMVTQTWQEEVPLILPKHRYGGMFAWRYPSHGTKKTKGPRRGHFIMFVVDL